MSKVKLTQPGYSSKQNFGTVFTRDNQKATFVI